MDTSMFNTVAELQVPYIIMHMQGIPQNMQKNPIYKNVVKDVLYYFSKKIKELRSLGMNDIIADPGFGFGKTTEHNYKLLNNLDLFKNLRFSLFLFIFLKIVCLVFVFLYFLFFIFLSFSLFQLKLPRGEHF